MKEPRATDVAAKLQARRPSAQKQGITMATFEEDLLRDAEDDRQTVEYIKNYLPQELKDRFSDDELYYFIDVIGEYYVDLLDKHSGSEEDIDIDVEEVAKYVARQAKKDKMGEFAPEDLRWVVDGELEYGESLEQ